MKLRNQNPPNEKPHWSPEEFRVAFLFWLLWSIYVVIAAILTVALFSNWPAFLHEQNYFK